MGNTTKYYLNGSKILAQSDDISTIYFHYGIDGVTGFNLDGIEYLYKKNIQNDIIGIYDTDGNEIVKYSYDAWGNHKTYILNDTGYVDISLKNTYTENGSLNKDIAEINPFRYRSYYYDSETNLYYLNSRYYDPEIGRFINADDISTLDVTKMVLNGINLYCYCLNNPIIYSDHLGNIPIKYLNKNIPTRFSGNNNSTSNYIERTHIKYSNKLIPFSRPINRIFGNIDISSSLLTQTGSPNKFYSFSDLGNDYSSMGVGFNLWDSFHFEIGVMDKGNIYFYMDNSIIHSKFSIGLDGLGFNFGIEINNKSYDLDINIGIGTIVLTAVSFIAAPILAPFAMFFGILFGL